MEIIVRIADDKYIRGKVTKRHDEALNLLLKEGMLDGLKYIELAQGN